MRRSRHEYPVYDRRACHIHDLVVSYRMKCQKCEGQSQLYLCQPCITKLRRQLLKLPAIVGDLGDVAVGHTRMGESSRQKGFESRPPPTMNGQAVTLISEITNTVGGWARGTARIHGLMISPPVTWHRPWDTYTHTASDYAVFLAANVDKLAKDPEVDELCAAVDSHLKSFAHIVSYRTPPQFCGPCPSLITTDHRNCKDCEKRPHDCAVRLMARRGALEVKCPGCGAVHRVERLVNHLLARADDFRCTVGELYRVMRMLREPVGLSTLYRWAEPKTSRRGSGQMRPAGYLRPDNRRIGTSRRSDADKPVYRVADARKIRAKNKEKVK